MTTALNTIKTIVNPSNLGSRDTFLHRVYNHNRRLWTGTKFTLSVSYPPVSYSFGIVAAVLWWSGFPDFMKWRYNTASAKFTAKKDPKIISTTK